MNLNRREIFGTLAATIAAVGAGCNDRPDAGFAAPQPRPVRPAAGGVDWGAVRGLFPLNPDWTHLASFLLVSHPRPVAEAIEAFRKKIDADPVWIEAAAFSESEGRPFSAIKRALADYTAGLPEEICLTSNTTTAIAMACHGLRIRADQHVLTTEHDHYSMHESLRFAQARSGSGLRYIAAYDNPRQANAGDIVRRFERAVGPKTRAVAMTWVHSSTGVKMPVSQIAEVVTRANRGRRDADRCLLIVDGVHGFGNQDVDVAKLGCDFFASGTHKWLFAPRGTGFLWGRKDVWPDLRPTIPTFNPEAPAPWEAWMTRTPLPPTQAAFVSPGGFFAYEYLLAVPAAVQLHRGIGRDEIASRIRSLSGAFRDGAAKLPNVTLHTPVDPELSAGISCFEVAGLAPEAVTAKLAEKKIRTNHSPYKVPYARVATGIMNTPAEVDLVLRELRGMV